MIFNKCGISKTMKRIIAPVLAFSLLTLSEPSLAVTVLKQGPNHSSGRFEQTVADIQVKVMGGNVTLVRDFKDGDWRFFTAWSPLKYRQVYVPGPSTNPGAGSWYDDKRAIIRNGYTYELEKDSEPLRYVYDSDTFIVKLDEGFRWQDRSGDWIEYTEDKHIRAYGDLQGTTAVFVHNTAGQIVELQDRFNNKVLEFSYQGETLSKVLDHSGRSVSYERDELGRLTKVTDVSGHEWLYDYEEFGQSNSSSMLPYFLKSITDPEQRVTTFKNAVVGGTISKECWAQGSGTGKELKEVVDPDTGMITIELVDIQGPSNGKLICRNKTIPRQVLTEALIDHDGSRHSYVYAYSEQSGSYLMQEVDADGVQTRRVMGPDGAVTKLFRGGELVYSQAKLDDKKIRLDGKGRKTITQYDSLGRIISITHPDGSTYSISYHVEYNLPIRLTDENGTITEFSYDDKGLLISLNNAKGLPEQLTTLFEYDENALLVKQTQIAEGYSNRITEYLYDQRANVTKVIQNGVTRAEFSGFNALGQPSQIKDGRGIVSTMDYDAYGRLLKLTEPLGKVSSMIYDKTGNLLVLSDPRGNQQKFSYNARGQLKTRTDAYEKQSHYSFSVQGQLLSWVDELGNSEQTLLDRAGRLASYTDANGNRTQFDMGVDNETFEGGFNDLKQILYPTYVQQYDYDNRQRVARATTVADEQERSSAYSYDKKGRLVRMTDAEGVVSTYSYDANGNLLREQTSGVITLYQYNPFGELVKVASADGVETSMEYDTFGRLVREQRTGLGALSYQYDNNDNLVSIIDGRGQQIIYEYDQANRRVKERHYTAQLPEDPQDAAQVAPIKVISYGYDTADNLISWNDGQFSGSMVWDKEQRLVSETVNYGSFSKTYAYTYLDNGTVASLAMPDGTRYAYEYDKNNQLTRVQIPGKGSMWVNEYHWTAPSKETLPGGITRTTSYDGLLNPVSVETGQSDQTALLSLEYGYDSLSRLSQRSINGDAQTFSYDELDRLLTVYRPGESEPAEQYDYDGNGNRTSLQGSSDWQYNETGLLISRGSGLHTVTYDYDANGNQTSRSDAFGTRLFRYDTDNRLKAITDADGNELAAYSYDPFGRRLLKETPGAKRFFLYAEEGLIAEYDASGNAINRYGYRPGSTYGTAPLFMEADGPNGLDYFYFHTNQVGLPIMLTDASGYQVWQAEFDSFGRLLVQAQSQIDNPLRFPGQYYDQESGLHYNWHRYYDAETGRYISSDPIGLYGGMNFYAYVGGNPLMRFDPMGLFSLCDILNVIPDVLKGTLKLGLGTGLGVSGDLTISEKGISGSVFAGIAVGAVGSWKSKVTSDLTSISGNWGGTKGGFNVGTKLQGYAGYGLVGSVAGEFGTNGMTLSGSVDVGAGAFGGVGFVVSGPILDCTIYDEC